MKKLFVNVGLMVSLMHVSYAGDTQGVVSWRALLPQTSQYTLRQVLQIRYDYLNHLRQKVGLIPLKTNSYLEQAALNHSRYLVMNNVAGHYESSSGEGYTGYDPTERAVYAGYPSRYVMENISFHNEDGLDSIDQLFSAIYHRFGFLNETIDEIGGGVAYNQSYYYKTAWTYDMGNSKVAYICSDAYPEFSGYGTYTYGICANENKKIAREDLLEAIADIESRNADIILWPYRDATDVLPVFYEEHPDPLPECSVSGYPVSVKFNEKLPNAPTLIDFRLFDERGEEVTNTKLLTEVSDPNAKLSAYEFALFPMERLEWGKKYNVEFTYALNGEEHTLKWGFTTRKLPYDYYVVTHDVYELRVVSGKSYALYVPPRDCNDVKKYLAYMYSRGLSIKNFGHIDLNTLHIRLEGDVGQYMILKNLVEHDVKLVISENDDALKPANGDEEEVIESSSSSIESEPSSESSIQSSSSSLQDPYKEYCESHGGIWVDGVCLSPMSSSSSDQSSEFALSSSTSSSSSSSSSPQDRYKEYCESNGGTWVDGTCIITGEISSDRSSSSSTSSNSSRSEAESLEGSYKQSLILKLQNRSFRIKGYYIKVDGLDQNSAFSWVYISSNKAVVAKIEKPDSLESYHWTIVQNMYANEESFDSIVIEKNKISFGNALNDELISGMTDEDFYKMKITEKLENNSYTIQGYYIKVDGLDEEDRFSWVYVSATANIVAKIEKPDNLEKYNWTILQSSKGDAFEDISISSSSGKITFGHAVVRD